MRCNRHEEPAVFAPQESRIKQKHLLFETSYPVPTVFIGFKIRVGRFYKSLNIEFQT